MSSTLQVGKPNKKGQILIERTLQAGSNNQTLYLLRCKECGTEHKTNGANVSTSRCPNPLCSIGIAKKLRPITARTPDPIYTANFEEIKSRIIELFSSVSHISMVRDCTLKKQKNSSKNRLTLNLDLCCGVSIEGKVKIIEEGGRIIEALAPELRKQESDVWRFRTK